MKKQITAVLLLMTIFVMNACKKDEGTHVDIVGRWQVAKVETTTAGVITETYTGTASDYIEFRSNDNNEMVVSLNAVSSIGNYYVLENNGLRFGYNGKIYSGQVTTISANKLEFMGTEEGATPAISKKYYLTK